MLELLKELLGIDITDNTKDTTLNFYIDKSKSSIQTYKNYTMTEDDFNLYTNQIIELTIYYYKNKDKVGYKSVSQGSRNISKESLDIPSDIKLSLGLPRIGVL